MDDINTVMDKDKTVEVKQTFLSNAISDISSYIQLADTKVSIIMATVIAIIAGLFACYEPIGKLIILVKPCSWQGITFIILTIVLGVSIICVFVFGILTIRSHVSKIGYETIWFLSRSTEKYSFNMYKEDVLKMSNEDVIVNMAAELYKLNDINRQKQATYRWALRFFSAFLIIFAVIFVFILLFVF